VGRKPISEEKQRRGARLASALALGRRRADLTQQALAARAGVDVDLLRKIERMAVTEPGFFTVADLALAAGMDMNSLATKTRATPLRTPHNRALMPKLIAGAWGRPPPPPSWRS